MMYNPQLDTFICVVEAGSFSKAADKLYISPPAVIKQINSLENNLDDLNWTNSSSRVSREHDDESLRDIALTEITPADWDSYDTVLKCTLCQGHYDFSFSDFYFIFVCCVEASK